MPAAALEAEVDPYMAESAAETDEYGRCLVVRNGRHRSRTARGHGAAQAVLLQGPCVVHDFVYVWVKGMHRKVRLGRVHFTV